MGVRFVRALIMISLVTVSSLLVADIYFPTYQGIHNNILIDPGMPLSAAVITMVIIVSVSIKKTVIEPIESIKTP